jgi:hypothetical protein
MPEISILLLPLLKTCLKKQQITACGVDAVIVCPEDRDFQMFPHFGS